MQHMQQVGLPELLRSQQRAPRGLPTLQCGFIRRIITQRNAGTMKRPHGNKRIRSFDEYIENDSNYDTSDNSEGDRHAGFVTVPGNPMQDTTPTDCLPDFGARFRRVGDTDFKGSSVSGLSGVATSWRLCLDPCPVFLPLHMGKLHMIHRMGAEKAFCLRTTCIGMSDADKSAGYSVCSLEQPIIGPPEPHQPLSVPTTTDTIVPKEEDAENVVRHVWSCIANSLGVESTFGVVVPHPRGPSNIFLLAKRSLTIKDPNSHTESIPGTMPLQVGVAARKEELVSVCLAHASILFAMKPSNGGTCFVPHVCRIHDKWLHTPGHSKQSLAYASTLLQSGVLHRKLAVDSTHLSLGATALMHNHHHRPPSDGDRAPLLSVAGGGEGGMNQLVDYDYDDVGDDDGGYNMDNYTRRWNESQQQQHDLTGPSLRLCLLRACAEFWGAVNLLKDSLCTGANIDNIEDDWGHMHGSGDAQFDGPYRAVPNDAATEGGTIEGIPTDPADDNVD